MANKIENPIELTETSEFRRAKVQLSWGGIVVAWQYRAKQPFEGWIRQLEFSAPALDSYKAPLEFLEEMGSAVQRVAAQARAWLEETKAQ